MENLETLHIDGDASVGRNVNVGGKATVQGDMVIKHNLKVEGDLDAPNRKDANKGVFETVEALRLEYPKPANGWYALVGEDLYAGKNGAWVLVQEGMEIATDGTAVWCGVKGPQGKDGPEGPQGKDGPEGKSAYQVWLDEGNTGTEVDFLNSLKAHVSKFVPVGYNSTAAGKSIGQTYDFALENPVDGSMVLMPNADSSATGSIMFSVSVQDGVATYTRVGDVAIDTSDFLSSSSVDATNLNNPTTNQIAKAADVKELRDNLYGVLTDAVVLNWKNDAGVEQVNDWILGYSSKNWVKNTSQNQSGYFVAVEQGFKVTIEKQYDMTWFAFLAAKPDLENMASNTAATLINAKFGTQSGNVFYLGSTNYPQTSETGIVPQGAHYMWVARYFSSLWRTPDVTMERKKEKVSYFASGQRVDEVSLTDEVVGNSGTELVSQRGLQPAITKRTPIDLYDETTVLRIPREPQSTNGGQFYDNVSYSNRYYQSRLIPVTPGQMYYIEGAGIGLYAYYAFVKPLDDSVLEELMTNTTDNVVGSNLFLDDLVAIGNSGSTITIPERCAYLCIRWSDFSSTEGQRLCRPKEVSLVELVKQGDFAKDVTDVVVGDNKVVFNGLRLIRAIISSNDNWYNTGSSSNQKYLNLSYILPVKAGQVFTVEAPENKTAMFNLAVSVPENNIFDASNGFPADLVPGTSRISVSANTTKEIAIPDGCNYLVIMYMGGVTNSDKTPKSMSYKVKMTSSSSNSITVESGLDYHNEIVRSADIGLTESNAVPLINEPIYNCTGNADVQTKLLDYSGYFGSAVELMVKMSAKNTNSSPVLGVGGNSYPIIYNGASANGSSNTWKKGELCRLRFDGTNVVLTTYDDTQIEGTNSVAVRNLSVQQRNVQKLCNRYRFLKWKPVIDTTVDDFKIGVPEHNHAYVVGWRRNTNDQNYGVPYSSVAQDQRYVGLNVSVYTFLSAVHNKYSLLYTECINGNSNYMKSAWGRHYIAQNASAYFGLVCCAFTAAVTGCMRNWNNNQFEYIAEQGYEFVEVNDIGKTKAESIRVGDVLNTNQYGHSIVVYQLFQDVLTGNVTHVRFAESTSGGSDNIYIRGCRFCLMGINDFVNKYMNSYKYTHYRYVKLYQDTLKNMEDGGTHPLLEESLPTDPANISLNYSQIATGPTIAKGRNGDQGGYDTAEQPERYVFSEKICTIAGDKVSFPTGKYSIGNIIAINYNLDDSIEDGTYSKIRVYKRSPGDTDYSYLESYPLSNNGIRIQYLMNHTVVLSRPLDSSTEGEYYACLSTDEDVDDNDKTYWEVIHNDTTITEETNGDYTIEWTREVVALYLMQIHDAVSPDPDPYFTGLSTNHHGELISLSTEEIKNKKCKIEAWRLKDVDKSKVYIRLQTVGIYGITGVYKKLT